MSPRVKATLILIATLIAGVVLGVVGSGAIANKRHADRRALRSERGLSARIESQLSNLSEQQREQIRAIARQHAPAMDSLRRKHRGELVSVFAEMRSEMAEVLTDQQRQELSEWLNRSGDFRDGRSRERRRQAPRP